MKDVTHVRAFLDELGACGLDVLHDEQQSLRRARRGRGESLAENDGAGCPGRSHLPPPPVLAAGEVAVQPPPQSPVEGFGAIDVRYRNDDDLQLGIEPFSARAL